MYLSHRVKIRHVCSHSLMIGSALSSHGEYWYKATTTCKWDLSVKIKQISVEITEQENNNLHWGHLLSETEKGLYTHFPSRWNELAPIHKLLVLVIKIECKYLVPMTWIRHKKEMNMQQQNRLYSPAMDTVCKTNYWNILPPTTMLWCNPIILIF